MKSFVNIVNSWELLYNFAVKLFVLDVCVSPDYLALLWVLFVRLFSDSHKRTNKKGIFSFKSIKFKSISGSLWEKAQPNTKQILFN